MSAPRQITARTMQTLMLADISSRHRAVHTIAHDELRCNTCNVPWPCEVANLLAEITASPTGAG